MKYVIAFVLGILIASGAVYVYAREKKLVAVLRNEVVMLREDLKAANARVQEIISKGDNNSEVRGGWKTIEGSGFTLQIPPEYSTDRAAGSLYVVRDGKAVMRISTDGRAFHIEPQGTPEWEYYDEVVRSIRFTR